MFALLAGAWLAAQPPADLRDTVERYRADLRALTRLYDVELSPRRIARMREFFERQRGAVDAIGFDALTLDAKIDWTLLRNHIAASLRGLDHQKARLDGMREFLDFAAPLAALEEARLERKLPDAADAAAVLDKAAGEIRRKQRVLADAPPADRARKLAANRASQSIGGLRPALKRWFDFYNGYDPLFSWWVAEPYKKLDGELNLYGAFLREKIAGIAANDRDTILGDPVGREALLSDLEAEMIAYSPEQLIQIAEREFEWCEREARKAAAELGYGSDWKKALEHVKKLYVPPGKQPQLILDLAREAETFLAARDLITVPDLARETWRMKMMTPERQRINPFFTGGEELSISYPTSGMEHEQKMMSMRGNNVHFSRATVFHEVIPGHHLQQFMNARHRPYRAVFATPFWTEGWSLYWEMLLWDLGFQSKAEDRIGALFWRMHRCARILFSLNFHLGKMTAQEAVDFLVDRVGHERENAAGEVRRSVEDASYPPLYQCAYMLGALQFRALHQELTGSGKMKNREFHDAVLMQHNMPVEMVRAALTHRAPARRFRAEWKFYGGIQ